MEWEGMVETAKAVVPAGKALLWVGTAVTGAFMAGVGATLNFGETADSLKAVPVMQAEIADARTRVSRLERQVNGNAQELTRIRCLARLSATGQTVDPLEIDDICP